MSADYTSWVERIRDKAARLSIVFLQIGYANEPARRALTTSGVPVLTVGEYLADRERTTGLVIIDKLETLASPAAGTQLGGLRQRVFDGVGADGGGERVVLLSRAPRMAFPAVPGSSLLTDASFAHAPILTARGAHELPTCLEDGADSSAVLEAALAELGAEVCAALDRALYEGLLTGADALALLDGRELEALDGAAITSPDGNQRTWNFPRHLAPLKKALDEVLTGLIEPQPQLSAVTSGMWKIERLIRKTVRQRAIAAWGDQWRTRCLNGDLPGKVLERAAESAYLGATSIKQLRDPLEWLSLGELLGLKDRAEIGGLGLGAPLWRQFGTQIMPVRNRLAHMRALHPDDAGNVVKWLRVLERRLTA